MVRGHTPAPGRVAVGVLTRPTTLLPQFAAAATGPAAAAQQQTSLLLMCHAGVADGKVNDEDVFCLRSQG